MLSKVLPLLAAGSAAGSNVCPAGQVPATQDQCLEAVKAVWEEKGRDKILAAVGQLEHARHQLVPGSWHQVPPGCSMQGGPGIPGDWAAHFNRNPNGNNDGGYTLVCVADPNGCPAGQVAPTEDQCLEAAKAVWEEKGRDQILAAVGQLEHARNVLVPGSWHQVPPGCSMQGGPGKPGDWAAHFNRNPNGKNDGGYTKVCLSPEPEAVPCDNDVTAIACRSFKGDADFQVEQVKNSGDDQVYDIKSFLPYNKALMAVTTKPWDKLSDEDDEPSLNFGQDADGCVFYEAKNGNQKTVRLTGSSLQSGHRHKCLAEIQYGCNDKGQKNPADRNAVEQEDRWAGKIVEKNNGDLEVKGGKKGRDGLVHATNRVTLKHLVQNLNTLGAVDLYYHRVQRNPIQGVNLKWIAENACKVSMPVSFQCTGSDCVEVQNIVCASFAGIDAKDYGVVSIECKVPPSKFVINSFKKVCKDSRSTDRDGDEGRLDGVSSNQPGGSGTQQTRQCLDQQGVEYKTPNHKFKVTQDGNWMKIAQSSLDFQFGAQGAQQACSAGTCSITVKSRKAIAQDSVISGSVSIHADVKSLNQVPRKWSEKLNHFHTAEFNLTRESAPEKVLEMPIGVNFYTDHCDQDALGGNAHPSGDDKTLCRDRSTVGKVAKLFAGGIDSVPFLSNQEVNLGQIKKNVHGYFRLVAKVNAKNTWFLKRAITALEVSVSGVDDGDFNAATYDPARCGPIQNNGKDKDTNSLSNTYKGAANSDYHKRGFPVAYMVCPKIMVGKHAAAGNVLRFSISWQLASLKTNAAGYTGKAQLLQDADEADPNAQSVEVQVTIQLGGGETNITTGTAQGGATSTDNTVTYIIVAVCVIGAALVLAVIVVAFMCLRSRSQAQLVAMSPKQAHVAAVYDISAPKKGEGVMDV